jgi:hypothetical protein
MDMTKENTELDLETNNLEPAQSAGEAVGHEVDKGKSTTFSKPPTYIWPTRDLTSSDDGVKAKANKVEEEKKKDVEAALGEDVETDLRLLRLHQRPVQLSLSDEMGFEQFMSFMKWKYPDMNEEVIGDAFDSAAPGGKCLSLIKVTELEKHLQKKLLS